MIDSVIEDIGQLTDDERQEIHACLEMADMLAQADAAQMALIEETLRDMI